MSNKLFIERHDSKEGYLAYMQSVVPTELHEILMVKDGMQFGEWVLKNVLKSATEWHCVKFIGKENWLYVIIDNVPLNKKRTMLSVLTKYGFKRTTLRNEEELKNCKEVWQWVPCPKFIANKKGTEGSISNLSNKFGETIARHNKNAPKGK